MYHLRLVVGLLDEFWQRMLQRFDRCKLASLSSSSFAGSSSDCASLNNGSVIACCCGNFLHSTCTKFLSTCSIVDLRVVRRCVIEKSSNVLLISLRVETQLKSLLFFELADNAYAQAPTFELFRYHCPQCSSTRVLALRIIPFLCPLEIWAVAHGSHGGAPWI